MYMYSVQDGMEEEKRERERERERTIKKVVQNEQA